MWLGSNPNIIGPLLYQCTLDSYYKYCELLPTGGQFPILFQYCTCHTLWKNVGLDRSTLNNYRPVSNLSYISKKAVARQINEHIAHEGISNENQSA